MSEPTIANICILAASENRAISDEDPSVYLPRLLAELSDEADIVFASNLLPSPHATDYATLGYEEFLKLRSGLIHHRMLHLCDGKNP